MDIEERFLKYVSIDTQSDEYSDTTPSTLKQLDLGKELVKELEGYNIKATIIGKITEKDGFLIEDGKKIKVDPPKRDELFNIQ